MASNWAQLMERRQQQQRESEEQAREFAAEVTARLLNERSKFLLDFTANEKRLFGVIE